VAQTFIQGAGEFFDRLDRVYLPEEIRTRVKDTLTVYLEDDGETIAPKLGSFSTFLSFLANHIDHTTPTIGVNHDGLVVAIWQEPQQFRLSLEFPPAGKIHCLLTEFSGGAPVVVRDEWASPDAVPLPPKRSRAFG
jgi:hypothetical protein